MVEWLVVLRERCDDDQEIQNIFDLDGHARADWNSIIRLLIIGHFLLLYFPRFVFAAIRTIAPKKICSSSFSSCATCATRSMASAESAAGRANLIFSRRSLMASTIAAAS